MIEVEKSKEIEDDLVIYLKSRFGDSSFEKKSVNHASIDLENLGKSLYPGSRAVNSFDMFRAF